VRVTLSFSADKTGCRHRIYFSAAAKALNLAQSHVSKAIKALEEEFRVTLFKRTTRSMTLSDEGARLLTHARAIIKRYGLANEDVRGEQSLPQGTLRILTSDGTGRPTFMPYVASFLQQYPLLNIDHLMSDRFLDLAENGIDAAVRIGDLVESAYKARRVGMARRITVVSPAYVERKGRPHTPLDLIAHDCVIFTRLDEYTHLGVKDLWEKRRSSRPLNTQKPLPF
jgi:DNA-binding transcriptional LysR family regulator